MSCRKMKRPGSSSCSAERRKNRRLDVELNMIVRLTGVPGHPPAAEMATTENISSGDAYFETSLGELIHVGDILDLDMELPIRSSTIFSEKRLSAKGKVVRLGRESPHEPDRRGVAITFLEPPAFHSVLG